MSRERSANTTLSHYLIVAKPGAGGMAEKNIEMVFINVEPVLTRSAQNRAFKI